MGKISYKDIMKNQTLDGFFLNSKKDELLEEKENE